jgi:hypothetical protein
VLEHVISERGIEVDKAKVDTVEQLPTSMDVKSLRSFLGHAHSIEDLLRTSRRSLSL